MMLGMQMRFVEDRSLIEWREDWSRVRSPSRARRRMRRGFPQNIMRFAVPHPDVHHNKLTGTFYGHPETIAKLKEQLRAQTVPHH